MKKLLLILLLSLFGCTTTISGDKVTDKTFPNRTDRTFPNDTDKKVIKDKKVFIPIIK